MLLRTYTILDKKAEVYTTPFFHHTHGAAERQFNQMCNENASTLAKYPEDYTLYHLGDIDDKTGKMIPNQDPVWIADAIGQKRPGPGPEHTA